MLLLHLSDLHFGPHSRFVSRNPAHLGKTFHQALDEARKRRDLPEKIDVVLVTGDVAESGKPKEFEFGRQFLTALAGELGLEHRRFVFVPGNHDISWPLCKKVAAEQEDEEFDDAELRRRLDAVKLQHYEAFLKEFYGVEDLQEVALPLGRGAFLYSFPDLRLSVGALNSCERESHRREDHLGHLSEEQARSLMTAWRTGAPAHWLKVVAVHHNPLLTVPTNIASWRDYLTQVGQLDASLIERYESDIVGFQGREHLKAIVEDTSVQLVLHGHHHAKDEQVWSWRRGLKGYAHVLSAGSLSLKPDKLPQDEPASVRLIRLDPEEEEVQALSLVYEARLRLDGELEQGAFVEDPAEPEPYGKRLDLPPSFETAATVQGSQTATGLSVPFLQTYRQAMNRAFSRWDLKPVGVTQAGGAGRPIEAALDEMYIPLRLAEGLDIKKTHRGRVMRPEDLLAGRNPQVIRGPAGAGKTTWMRWTFRRLLEIDQAFPLMLVLRDLARRWQGPNCQGAARSLDAFLESWIAEWMGKGWETRMESILAGEDGPRPVLLVDGWDELGALGDEVREKLLGLMERHPRMAVVVTSRPYGEGRPSHSEGFTVQDIQPLSDEEILGLTQRFFRLCYGLDAQSAVAETERFQRALNRSPEATGLARIALLLTMMLMISRSGPLPDKRHLLYEACVTNLLMALPDLKAEEGALLAHGQWRPEDSEERKRVVARLAFQLQKGRARELSFWEPLVVKSWEEMAALLTDVKPSQRTEFLAWLSGSAGLLTDRADGTLAFAHLSFQEYLAAWHLHATFEGADERAEAFSRLLLDMRWWETLRLWAALIERESPARLSPVLQNLQKAGRGLSLMGTFFADGLASPESFDQWINEILRTLSRGWPLWFEQCTSAWAASRQEVRKQQLATRLVQESTQSKTWTGWLRLKAFYQPALDLSLPAPPARLSQAVLRSLDSHQPDQDSIAAGRILCGFSPLWPVVPLGVGLLQSWPSQRRLLGLRLQGALTLGASHQELVRFAEAVLPFRSKREWGWRISVRDFARTLYRDLTPYKKYIRDATSLKFLQNFIRDLARYLAYHTDLELSRELAEFLTPYMAKFFNRSPYHYLDSDETREIVGELIDDFAQFPFLTSQELRRDKKMTPLPEFLYLEQISLGRAGARATLTHAKGSLSLELPLLSEACRWSLHPKQPRISPHVLLNQVVPWVDPLWPTLARHLARWSTPEDKALLEDLARHPEKREPPLSWGLQFIVRGDLLQEDGSILTLDEITDELGLPPLPYLEDMPDELDIDWDAEDPEPQGSPLPT